MAHAITSYNCPYATANSSSHLIRPTSSACPILLPGTHFFPAKPSQWASPLSRRSCSFSCSESGQGVLFHVGERLNVMGFCFSGIVEIKAGNLSLRCYRKKLRCSGEAKEEVSADLAPRVWSPCVRHVLFCSSYSAMRIGSKQRASSSVSEAFGVTESGLFSLSSDELLSRGFELHSSYEGIDLDQLNSLFLKVGFPRRQKEKLTRALRHTLSLFWLRDVKSDQMIAFARATGDNVFNAIIWDVVVDPSYQGAGLGKAVMERLMADLVKRGISNIALYAESNVVGFYRPLGFVSDPDGIRAMAYSRKRR